MQKIQPNSGIINRRTPLRLILQQAACPKANARTSGRVETTITGYKCLSCRVRDSVRDKCKPITGEMMITGAGLWVGTPARSNQSIICKGNSTNYEQKAEGAAPQAEWADVGGRSREGTHEWTYRGKSAKAKETQNKNAFAKDMGICPSVKKAVVVVTANWQLPATPRCTLNTPA